jgi:hypothetical protein
MPKPGGTPAKLGSEPLRYPAAVAEVIVPVPAHLRAKFPDLPFIAMEAREDCIVLRRVSHEEVAIRVAGVGVGIGPRRSSCDSLESRGSGKTAWRGAANRPRINNPAAQPITMATSLRAEKDMIAIPREEYEEMRETLDLLQDPERASRVLGALDEARRGKTISEREFARRFKL